MTTEPNKQLGLLTEQFEIKLVEEDEELKAMYRRVMKERLLEQEYIVKERKKALKAQVENAALEQRRKAGVVEAQNANIANPEDF